MTSRAPHLKRFVLILAVAAIVTPTTAQAGKPEAKQIAAFLSNVLPQQPTPAESGRAEAKAFANFMRVTTAPSYPTPAESGRAEAEQIASYLRGTLAQPQVTVYGPGGFDWGDAAIGAGFVGGLALLLGGAVLALRRRRVLAHPAR